MQRNLMVNFVSRRINKVVFSFELKEIKSENEATAKNHNSRSL